MNTDVAAFDAWMDAAEQSAARMGAAAVDRLQSEGDAWIERFADPSVSREDVLHAHMRLVRYRDLIQFLQRSLHTALCAAAHDPGAGYDEHAGASRPAMLGRYV